jgi:hypothetical protein
MIEKTYSAFIAHHADALVRAALLDSEPPPPGRQRPAIAEAMMPARKPWCPRIKGWMLLDEALNLIKATPGSRTEQEICDYLRTGQLPAKYWRQSAPRVAVAAPVSLVATSEQWQDADPDFWTLEYLRKVRSVDGVVQGGKRNWYHVRETRLEELYPAIRKSGNVPPTQIGVSPRKARRITWATRWTDDKVRYSQGRLPPNKDDYLIELEAWILDNFDVKPEAIRRGELQRFANALYAGKTKRPLSTDRRKQTEKRKR